MKMNWKEYVVFLLVVFAGGIVGQWLVQVFRITSTDLVGQLLTFVIPTTVIYIIWKKFGQKAAR
jgi:uncharacterized membrane protein YfcA